STRAQATRARVEGARRPPPRAGARRSDSAQAELGRARGPGSPALHVQQVLGHPDLLLAGGVGRVARATGGVPALLRELQTAVVAVAGVDRSVAARPALGEAVPHGATAAAGGRRRGGLRLGGRLGGGLRRLGRGRRGGGAA